MENRISKNDENEEQIQMYNNICICSDDYEA